MSEKFWLTKHALTDGIITTDATETVRDDRISYCKPGDYFASYYTIGKDAHRSEAEAKARAIEMRDKKIASLQKQIAKLQKLRF